MKKKSETHRHDAKRPDPDVDEPQRDDSESRNATETTPDREAELEERLRRAMADFANFRKRQAKDLEDARRRALEGLATELLPVLDNFEFARAAHRQQGGATDADADAAMPTGLIEGLEMVRSLLLGVLERHGLAEIPADGEVFDPMKHEAVGVDTTAAGGEPGRVTQVVQSGYTMGDKVIRASRVIVSGEAGQPGHEERDDRDDGEAGGSKED